MGLAEKRAVKEFQDSRFPELTKDLSAAARFPVNVEVQWETVTEDGMAHLVSDSLLKVYFQPVIEAFREICADEMGKEALEAALQKVLFCNTVGASNPAQAISFEHGVLRVDHQPYTNMDDIADRRKHIVKVLEQAL